MNSLTRLLNKGLPKAILSSRAILPSRSFQFSVLKMQPIPQSIPTYIGKQKQYSKVDLFSNFNHLISVLSSRFWLFLLLLEILSSKHPSFASPDLLTDKFLILRTLLLLFVLWVPFYYQIISASTSNNSNISTLNSPNLNTHTQIHIYK